MRIAFLTPYLPYPPDTGGKNRTYNLLKRLGQAHSVDLYVPAYEPVRGGHGDLDEFCANIWIYVHQVLWTRRQLIKDRLTFTPATVLNFSRPGTITEMRSDLAERNYDLIFVDELVMAPYAWELHGTPKVLARQKADSRYFWDVAVRCPWGRSKLWNLREALLLRLYERRVWSVYQKGVVVSEQERELFLSINPQLELCVAPNGVDLEAFQFKPIVMADKPLLLFHGTMSYYANVDALLFFTAQIYPLIRQQVPSVKLLVVGQSPGPEVKALASENDGIEVTGTVPDVRPFLERSTVVVVPVRIGHGTRLKIAEAMAIGRPVVSTTVGCEGLAVRDGHDLFIADTPQAFADAVVRLTRDIALRRRVASNARALVSEAYTWDSIGAHVELFCRKAVASENRVAP